jgi:hypothetical protein
MATELPPLPGLEPRSKTLQRPNLPMKHDPLNFSHGSNAKRVTKYLERQGKELHKRPVATAIEAVIDSGTPARINPVSGLRALTIAGKLVAKAAGPAAVVGELVDAEKTEGRSSDYAALEWSARNAATPALRSKAKKTLASLNGKNK